MLFRYFPVGSRINIAEELIFELYTSKLMLASIFQSLTYHRYYDRLKVGAGVAAATPARFVLLVHGYENAPVLVVEEEVRRSAADQQAKQVFQLQFVLRTPCRIDVDQQGGGEED